MARKLVLETVGDEGVNAIATIGDGETVLGREPDNGIAVDHNAISREHGKILRVRNHWFYSDLGSTNGSWVNGIAAPGNQWRIIRPNDYLQLADKALRLKEVEGESGSPIEVGVQQMGGRSLVVFRDGAFSDEFPIPEFGRALVVGGAKGDLEIRGDVFENPALVVECRAQGVCAYSVEQQHRTELNGEVLGETTEISDRDIIVLKEYMILFNDPPILSAGGFGAGMSGGADGDDQGLRSWGDGEQAPDLVRPGDTGVDPFASAGGDGKRPALSSQFGRDVSDSHVGHDETMAIESSQFKDVYHGAEQAPSTRYSYDDESEYSFSSTEDQITIFVGIFLLILLLILVVWWVFLV